MDKKEIQEIVDAFDGRALSYNVIIFEIPNVNITDGGLDMTLAVKKESKFNKGIVVSIGTACPKDDVKLGDIVMFDKNKVTLFPQNTIEYQAMYYADLVHVL